MQALDPGAVNPGGHDVDHTAARAAGRPARTENLLRREPSGAVHPTAIPTVPANTLYQMRKKTGWKDTHVSSPRQDNPRSGRTAGPDKKKERLQYSPSLSRRQPWLALRLLTAARPSLWRLPSSDHIEGLIPNKTSNQMILDHNINSNSPPLSQGVVYSSTSTRASCLDSQLQCSSR